AALGQNTTQDIQDALAAINENLTRSVRLYIPGLTTNDTTAPTSVLYASVSLEAPNTIIVGWSAFDTQNLVTGVTVWGRPVGLGDWTLLVANASRQGSAAWTNALDGVAYEFKSTSTDAVGNQETDPAAPQHNWIIVTYHAPERPIVTPPTSTQEVAQGVFKRPFLIPGPSAPGALLVVALAALLARPRTAKPSRGPCQRAPARPFATCLLGLAMGVMVVLLFVPLVAGQGSPPAAPGNLRAVPGSGTINLTWDPPVGATTTSTTDAASVRDSLAPDQNAAAFTWEPASQATTLQTAQNIETGLASIPSTYLQQSFTVPTSGFLYQASFELQFTPACSQTEWFEIQLWQGTTMLADSASDAITPWIVGTHSPWGLPATFTRAVPLNPGVTYALRLLPSARMCANEKVSLMDSLSGGTANLAGHCVSKDPTTGLMNDVGQYCGLLVSLHDTTINQAASKWWPPSIPSTDVRAPGPAQTLPTSYAGPNGLNARYAGFKVTTTSRVDRIDLSITGCAGLTQGAWTLYATDSSGQPTTP